MNYVMKPLNAEVKLITVDEVCYFQSDTKYTRVVIANCKMAFPAREG